MKKLSLLAIGLLTSLVSLDAATKDDYPCKQMAEGYSGSSCRKVTFDVVTVLAFLKLGMPEGLIAIYFPFIADLAEYEVNKLREEATTLSQQEALAIVSKLNNGWYIHATMGAIIAGGYAYYGNALFDTKHPMQAEYLRNVIRAMLGTYAVSQLTAATLAHKATSGEYFPSFLS